MPFIMCALFVAFVMAHGVPALRHDWNWPVAPEQVRGYLLQAWTGWDPSGIGNPVAYPTNYLITLPIFVLLLTVGPTAGLAAFVFAIAFVVVYGAQSLIRTSSTVLKTGLTAFALFNPWVYTKVIAGHLIMVLCYGAIMLLTARLLEPNPKWKRLFLALVLASGQIQFFIIGMMLLLLRGRNADARRAMMLGVLIYLPIIVGVAAEWRSLAATPYTLVWQQSQSVSPGGVWLLSGYFAHYADKMGIIAVLAVACGVSAAMLGFASAWVGGSSRREVITVAAIAAVFGVLATGTSSVIAPVYTFLVEHAPATGLFRELFDLVGFVAIGYVALAGFARGRIAPILALSAGTFAVCGWIIAPPFGWFVSHSHVPKTQFAAPPNTRFALYPAFQPMSLADSGSGADPDAFMRWWNVMPLNQYSIQYPASTALLRYEITGRTETLSALSVATIVSRPWFRTDAQSLNLQLAHHMFHVPGRVAAAVQRITPLPELSLIDRPAIGSVADRLGDGNVFFGDVPSPAGSPFTFAVVSAGNRTVDWSQDWVNANFTFLSEQEVAQGIGGAATSSTRSLEVAPSRYLLVFVRGVLFDNEHRIASQTRRYSWVPTGTFGASQHLRCAGFCVVVGGVNRVPAVPANPPARRYKGLAFSAPVPWLAVSHVPPSAFAAVRYNVRYDRWWTAFLDGRLLTHARLDQTVNGWYITKDHPGGTLYIVNVLALLQALLELIGAAVSGIILARTLAAGIA